MTFSNRPDHPDFWLLAQCVQDNDAQADSQTVPFEDILARVVDPNSLTYMAKQRALRVVGSTASKEEEARWAAMFVDGFMVGAAFQAQKDLEAQSPE